MTPAPPEIAAIFAQAPKAAQERLAALRRLIFEVAETAEVGALEETLKWGEPAYLPKTPRVGTTLRISWSPKRPDEVSLFVPCQTTLVDQYRNWFPGEFRYEGNRAVHLPLHGPMSELALGQIITLALTYHRDRRGKP